VDKLSHYRNIVKQVLSQHAAYVPSHGQIETLPVFDESHDQYLLVDVGWDRTGVSDHGVLSI
jgi:XisI protein